MLSDHLRTHPPAVEHKARPRLVGHAKGHLHVLRCVAIGAVLQFLPAAQVGSGTMEQVAVAGGQQLAHQHYERVDPNHDEMLT